MPHEDGTRELDDLFMPLKEKSEQSRWLMTPVVVINNGVFHFGCVPELNDLRKILIHYKGVRMKKKVLFLCTHNSCRSQMAEGLLRDMAGDKFEVYSAGVEPTSVHPLAKKVLQEIGIDISGQQSKSVDEFLDKEFDYVITVCDNARQTCPFFPR